jgi:hypothetical protein
MHTRRAFPSKRDVLAARAATPSANARMLIKNECIPASAGGQANRKTRVLAMSMNSLYTCPMTVKDPDIFGAIDRIGVHYRSNIQNRYTRRALQSIPLDPGAWSLIETLTEKIDDYRYQDFSFNDLYSQVIAISKFIFHARTDVLPRIRYLAGEVSHPADKVYRDLAVNNFGANLKILADQVNELYIRTVTVDKRLSGMKPPVCARIPELKEIGRYLVG